MDQLGNGDGLGSDQDASAFREQVHLRRISLVEGLSTVQLHQCSRDISEDQRQNLLAIAAELQLKPAAYRKLIENPFDEKNCESVDLMLLNDPDLLPEAIAIAEPELYQATDLEHVVSLYTPEQVDAVAEGVLRLKQALGNIESFEQAKDTAHLYEYLRDQVFQTNIIEEIERNFSPFVRRNLQLLLVRATRMCHESFVSIESELKETSLKEYVEAKEGVEFEGSVRIEYRSPAFVITLEDQDYSKVAPSENSSGFVRYSLELPRGLSGKLIFIQDRGQADVARLKQQVTLEHERLHVLFDELFCADQSLRFIRNLESQVQQTHSIEDHEIVALKLWFGFAETARDELVAYSTELDISSTRLDQLGFGTYKKSLSAVIETLDEAEISNTEKASMYSKYAHYHASLAHQLPFESYLVRRLYEEARSAASSLTTEKAAALLSVLPPEISQRQDMLCLYIGMDRSQVYQEYQAKCKSQLAKVTTLLEDLQLNSPESMTDELLHSIDELIALAPLEALPLAFDLYDSYEHPTLEFAAKSMIFNALSRMSINSNTEEYLLNVIQKQRDKEQQYLSDSSDISSWVKAKELTRELEEFHSVIHCNFESVLPLSTRIKRIVPSRSDEISVENLERVVDELRDQDEKTWQQHFPKSTFLNCADKMELDSLLKVSSLIARYNSSREITGSVLLILNLALYENKHCSQSSLEACEKIVDTILKFEGVSVPAHASISDKIDSATLIDDEGIKERVVSILTHLQHLNSQ